MDNFQAARLTHSPTHEASNERRETVSNIPPHLHKQALKNIAAANLRMVIWPDGRVDLEPVNNGNNGEKAKSEVAPEREVVF